MNGGSLFHVSAGLYAIGLACAFINLFVVKNVYCTWGGWLAMALGVVVMIVALQKERHHAVR
jgi:hypothetical protein